MTMLDESCVRQIMRTRLQSTAGLPDFDSRMAWENRVFAPPDFDQDGPIDEVLWVREWLDPMTEIKSSSGFIEAVGLTIWGVYTPKGRGTRGAENLAKNIAERFEAGRSLTDDSGTTITLERTSRGRFQSDEERPIWVFKPVTVRWRVFTQVTA